MKSLIFITCLLSALGAIAQSADKSYIANSEYLFDSLTIKANISAAAIKSFEKQFSGVVNPVWHATAKENTVKFYRDDVRYLVFYNRKGKWNATIKYITPDLLPRWIASRIAADFTDYSIFFSQHIATPAGNIYLVKIEKGNEWKSLKLTREVTEVMGEYVRK